MTFKEYYIAELKHIPFLWKRACRERQLRAFWLTVLFALSPLVMYMMYLYDTGRLPADKHYFENSRNETEIKKCARD